MRGRGLLDKKNPHISATQIRLGDECMARWYDQYSKGIESDGFMLRLGSIVHRCLHAINKAAKESADGIALEDVNPILEREAENFESFGWYSKVAEGLRRYAEKINDRRQFIVGMELDLSCMIQCPSGPVKLVGRLDLLSRNEANEYEIGEGKTVGVIPSVEELEVDIQTSIYNLLVRETYGNLGMVWKTWHSIIHGVTISARADMDDAEAARRYVVGAVERMRKAVKNGKVRETPHRYCMNCHRVKVCKAWKNEMHALHVSDLQPTLGDYARIRARASALDEAKKNLSEHVKRLVEEAGGVYLQDGFRAELRHSEGGKEISYTSKPFTSLIVKAAR